MGGAGASSRALSPRKEQPELGMGWRLALLPLCGTAAEKWSIKLAWLSYTKKVLEVAVPERVKNKEMDRISIKSPSGIKCALSYL